MDINTKQSIMRKIIDKIIFFFKSIFKFKTKKIEFSNEPEVKVNRLTYTKRTDN
jgi:hypothetical protein